MSNGTLNAPLGIAGRLLTYFVNFYDEVRKEKVKWTFIFISVAFLVLVVCYPIGILFLKSVLDKVGNLTLNNYFLVATEPGLLDSLKNTIILAVSSTLFCIFLALPMAFAVARTNMPLKNLIGGLILASFVIPSFIQAIAWILLLGPRAGMLNVFLRTKLGLPFSLNIFSMPGLVFVCSLNFFPFIYFSVLAALYNIDPAYEEAARVSGAKPLRTAVGISFPLISPALVSGTILTFLHGAAVFGAPVALALPARFHVLTTRIYQLFSYPPRYELAAACATPIVMFTVLGLILQKYYLGRKQFHTITGKAGRPQAIDVGKWRYVFAGCCLFVLFVAVVLPMTVLLRTSLTEVWGLPLTLKNFTFINYKRIFDPTFYALLSMKNTVYLGVLASTVCVLLSVVIVWMIERGKVKGKQLLGFLCMITFAFPSAALAVGILLAFMPSPFSLQGTLTIILVGLISKRISYAYVLAGNTMKQVHPEFEEASRMVGASWFQSVRDITIPILKSGLLVAWILVLAACLRELPIAILLYLPGNQTMAVQIFNLLDDGNLEGAATLSLILAVVSIGAVFIVRKMVGKGVMEH